VTMTFVNHILLLKLKELYNNLIAHVIKVLGAFMQD
jgi:hypothetical protein